MRNGKLHRVDGMKEKPIIFNGQMVRAILEGRKTQTRRMMKPQPELRMGGFWHWKDCQWADGGIGFPKTGIEDHAPYQPGDRLWVRETFSQWYDDDDFTHLITEYRADTDGKCRPAGWSDFIDAPAAPDVPVWRPSIHMPRELSRITLEVTDVRAERLQGISEEDAQAEGVEKSVYLYTSDGDKCRESYRSGFARQWDAIYMNWNCNPWVWVIFFEVLDVKKK